MQTQPSTTILPKDLETHSLLNVLRERRSRRFGLGMGIPAGPLAYQSRHPAMPLSEGEEAALVFAACGITGHALADLCYAPGGGGNIMAGLLARTIASGDGLQTVSLIVTNDKATYLIRKPRELPAADIPELILLGRRGEFSELYRRSRVKIKDSRSAPPTEPLFNINANQWSAHAPGTSYFLPVNDLTFMYINGLLEILNETTGVFLLDERNHFRPAGLGKFARSRGGHLEDNPHKGRVATVRQVEQFVTEFVTAEQGMMLQNLGLMAQALGLGGFPNFANHEFGWFQALGFRMAEMPVNRYVGAGPVVSFAMKLLKRNPGIPYPVGLEKDGEVLLKPFCPPYFATMTEAVRAVAEIKFGARGLFRDSAGTSAWQKHGELVQQIPSVSEVAIQATAAYCEYLWQRYGRFPVYMPPYRTVLGFQACHLDAEFYDRFYRPGVLSENQRENFQRNVQ
ncbi:MAG TPA: hypothetical protein VH597_03065 [Verrucomicrobiae bacterium]|jgi:hypothetical protein|nr:hypothetical protein [Verrucomicrobiae bacterium]